MEYLQHITNNTDESGSDSDDDPQEIATAVPKTEENVKSRPLRETNYRNEKT